MPTIRHLDALEILDSRGRPTLMATCTLESGISASASVPSGASTGAAEAHELRDGDPKRYRGLGCRRAVDHVRGPILEAVGGRAFVGQDDLDRELIDLDGTPDKSKLGANALLAVSVAFARAAALETGQPLYSYFADLRGEPPTALPRPMINLYSGGKHAGEQVAIQDVQVMALTTATIDDTLARTFDAFYAAVNLMRLRFDMRLLRADEGGLAPPFDSSEAMLAGAVDAIIAAGLHPGVDMALTVDVAASHFYRGERYHLGENALDAAGMIDVLLGWLRDYPIASLEDGLAEDDWDGWAALAERAPAEVLLLGDDLLCTNPARIQFAIEEKAASALLLKVNQIGTLSEALTACNLAKDAGWRVVVSARSGETEDDWLADLAVGWDADHIKVGAITQSERLSKYNRLLAIEAATGLPVRPAAGG